MISDYFGTSKKFLSWEYADIYPTATGTMAPEFLQSFSAWLGVSNQFRMETPYKKQSILPLPETVRNYDEVAAVLKGTKFEYCLDDEPSYGSAVRADQ